MRKRPVADLTKVSETSMSARHLSRNQTRFTSHMSDMVPGKKSATPSPKTTKVLSADVIWNRASSGPPK